MTDHSPSELAPDDAALIERWRSGDERAATTLVERHAQAIARFVASLGERDKVEEVCRTRSCAPSDRWIPFAARAPFARGC